MLNRVLTVGAPISIDGALTGEHLIVELLCKGVLHAIAARAGE